LNLSQSRAKTLAVELEVSDGEEEPLDAARHLTSPASLDDALASES